MYCNTNRANAVTAFISHYSDMEKGWQWAEKNGMFQDVMVAVTNEEGNTLCIHKVLADPTQTTFIYTVKASGKMALHSRFSRFNGRPFFGNCSSRFKVIDGVYVGSIATDPLPEENGTVTLGLSSSDMRECLWEVSFPVTREPLTKMTRYIPINYSLNLPKGMLLVEQLVISPVQTVVQMRFTGDIPGFYPGNGPKADFGLTLSTAADAVKQRGANCQGQRVENGWEENYNIEFQRLEPVPSAVTVKLSGFVYKMAETHIPLIEGHNAQTPNGRLITVARIRTEGSHSTVFLRFAADEIDYWPLDLNEGKLLDNVGQLHDTRPPRPWTSSEKVLLTDKSNSGQAVSFEWELPAGRSAEYLIIPGYWDYNEKLAEINIPTED